MPRLHELGVPKTDDIRKCTLAPLGWVASTSKWSGMCTALSWEVSSSFRRFTTVLPSAWTEETSPSHLHSRAVVREIVHVPPSPATMEKRSHSNPPSQQRHSGHSHWVKNFQGEEVNYGQILVLTFAAPHKKCPAFQY